MPGVASQKKGKKSPLGQRNKGKKMKVNLSQPAIKLPTDMSPEDASVIEAHMNAYTKWLLENNMLVSQQSLNQFARPSQGVDMPPTMVNVAGSSSGFKVTSGQDLNTQFDAKKYGEITMTYLWMSHQMWMDRR